MSTSSPQPSESIQAKGFASLISLLLVGLVDNQILAPILPAIASEFEVSVGQVGTTVSGYALAAAMAALVGAPFSDRLGRLPFLLAAGAVFAGGSVLAFSAPSFATFGLARVVTGAAAGLISALVVAWIADRVPYERRGRVMSWVASAYFAAPIFGVPACAWLADTLGWRAVYIAFAGAALLVTGALAVWAREIHDSADDDSGRALRSERGYLRFLKGRATAAGALSAFFVSGGITGFITYLGAFLSEQFGLSVTQIGLVFLLSGAASLVGAFGAGRLSDQMGKRRLAIGGSLALALFILLVPALPGGLLLYGCLGLVGLAAASRVAPLQSLVTELVSRDARGAYVALRNTLSQLGIAASAALGAALYVWGGFSFVCYLAVAFSLAAAALLFLVQEPVVAPMLEQEEPAS